MHRHQPMPHDDVAQRVGPQSPSRYIARYRRNSEPAASLMAAQALESVQVPLKMKRPDPSRQKQRRRSSVPSDNHTKIHDLSSIASSKLEHPIPSAMDSPVSPDAVWPCAEWSHWRTIAKTKVLAESHLRILIPDRLAFLSLGMDELEIVKEYLQTKGHYKFVSSKLHRNYWPLCADFGPVSLGAVYRFCRLIQKVLSMHVNSATLIYYIQTDKASRANAAFLLAAYLVLVENKTPDEAAAHFTDDSAPFPVPSFRDASYGPQEHELNLVDCLRGLRRAVELGWFNLETFNVEAFELLDDPEHGDLHQICPNFVAFKGPLAAGSPYRTAEECVFPPQHYARIFQRLRVSAVVRLNEPDTYPAGEFSAAGLRHYDLYFPDCTPPPAPTAAAFLAVAAAERRTAVHCRAGLGRTGTLIALWMMARRGFSADEAIAWLRIVRPGSVIGPQQHYLKAHCCRAAGAVPRPLLRRPASVPTGLSVVGASNAHFLSSVKLMRAALPVCDSDGDQSGEEQTDADTACAANAGPTAAYGTDDDPSCARDMAAAAAAAAHAAIWGPASRLSSGSNCSSRFDRPATPARSNEADERGCGDGVAEEEQEEEAGAEEEGGAAAAAAAAELEAQAVRLAEHVTAAVAQRARTRREEAGGAARGRGAAEVGAAPASVGS